MAQNRQFSFSAGEITTALYARADQTRYQTGLRTLRNFIVQKTGGVANRPGTKFVGEIRDSAAVGRLIPFQNATKSYAVELGNLTMQFVEASAYNTHSSATISAATKASPCVITAVGHAFSNGDLVYITGVSGMIELNGRTFKVAGVSGNTFQLTDHSYGTNVNSSSYTTYTSGGTVARIYKTATSYATADLFDLKHSQVDNVLSILHTGYAPTDFTWAASSSWSSAAKQFLPAIGRPVNGTGTAGTAGSNSYRYRVTATSESDDEESLPGYGAAKTITGATQANPCEITSASHGLTTGDEVLIESVGGMTQLNDRTFYITRTGANTFTLDNENSTSHTAYTSGGTAKMTHITVGVFGALADAPTVSAPHTITWTAPATGTARYYNIYKDAGGTFGWIGTAFGLSFKDKAYEPDITDTHPLDRDLFDSAGEYPSTITHYQHRIVVGASSNEPSAIWAGRVGVRNFTQSLFVQDGDAIKIVLKGRKINQVKHLVDIGPLLILTSSSELGALGNSNGILTPDEQNVRTFSYNGSADVQPVVLGRRALYVDAKETIIRDIGSTDGYSLDSGGDVTIFSSHLFRGYTIVDWAIQTSPDPILWVVRSDGVLLSCTMVPEHAVLGWARHDFDGGTVESVCVVQEGSEDVLYLVVKRTINSVVRRYVERMSNRYYDDIKEATFLDSYRTYDGRNTAGVISNTLSGGTDWDQDESLTITRSSGTGGYTSLDIGKVVQLNGVDTDGEAVQIRCTITAVTDTTHATVTPHRTVPTTMRSVAITDWALATATVTDLWHLEGQSVAVFADGFVVASPNNESYTAVTVSNGAITLDRAYGIIHVGLPYISDLQTLDVETAQGEALITKQKLVRSVSMHVEATRGLFVGPEAPEDDDEDPLEGLNEPKIRNLEGYDSAVSLLTGVIDQTIDGKWSQGGRVFVRQVDPIPATILSITAVWA